MTIETFKLENKNGIEMTVTNLGCAIISLNVPTNEMGKKDIVLGFDKAEDYKGEHPFFGVVAGRFANRICKGKFELGGKTHQLETNDGANHLHGGSNGFDKKTWNVVESSASKIVFEYDSPDGEENYPGNLKARVTYTLTDDNVLRMDYYNTTDSETGTICNLTNHSYFNLEGHDGQPITGHELQVLAKQTTAVDEELIPTGELKELSGTPYCLYELTPIGKNIDEVGKLSGTGGYDHNYVLEKSEGIAAVLYSPVTKIRMTVSTNSPGLQIYTANNLDGSLVGKGGVKYPQHGGVCLETQIFPDAPNHTNFPSSVVSKDKPQSFYTEFKFEM
jgi:aldose 1-epimerase